MIGELLKRCQPANDTPGEKYLLSRGVKPVRDTVWFGERSERLPMKAEGMLVFVYRDAADKPAAAYLTAVDAQGGRVLWRGRAKTRNMKGTSKADGWFEVKPATGSSRLAICEGEITAMAIALLRPGWTVRAAGGCTMMRPQLSEGRWDHVVVDIDGDDVGRQHGLTLADDLTHWMHSVTVVWRRDGEDAADELARRKS